MMVKRFLSISCLICHSKLPITNIAHSIYIYIKHRHYAQGKAQLISNINACQSIADMVRTTLGPRGMDKLVADGRRVTISNDGATIMRLLEIEHPAAKTLVDISMSQVSCGIIEDGRFVAVAMGINNYMNE